jgi:hypothetical protein
MDPVKASNSEDASRLAHTRVSMQTSSQEQRASRARHVAHPPEGEVEAQCHPRERNVVSRVKGRPHPLQLGESESAVRHVVHEVAVVIKDDETVVQCRRIHDEGDQCDKERHQPFVSVASSFRSKLLRCSARSWALTAHLHARCDAIKSETGWTGGEESLLVARKANQRGHAPRQRARCDYHRARCDYEHILVRRRAIWCNCADILVQRRAGWCECDACYCRATSARVQVTSSDDTVTSTTCALTSGMMSTARAH